MFIMAFMQLKQKIIRISYKVSTHKIFQYIGSFLFLYRILTFTIVYTTLARTKTSFISILFVCLFVCILVKLILALPINSNCSAST